MCSLRVKRWVFLSLKKSMLPVDCLECFSSISPVVGFAKRMIRWTWAIKRGIEQEREERRKGGRREGGREEGEGREEGRREGGVLSRLSISKNSLIPVPVSNLFLGIKRTNLCPLGKHCQSL